MQRLPNKKRARYSPEDRKRFVALWRKSDQTQVEFAKRCGLKLTTLRQWLHRGGPTSADEPAVNLREITALVPSWPAPPTVEIAVGPEITVRLGGSCRPELIAQVVQHLRRSC